MSTNNKILIGTMLLAISVFVIGAYITTLYSLKWLTFSVLIRPAIIGFTCLLSFASIFFYVRSFLKKRIKASIAALCASIMASICILNALASPAIRSHAERGALNIQSSDQIRQVVQTLINTCYDPNNQDNLFGTTIAYRGDDGFVLKAALPQNDIPSILSELAQESYIIIAAESRILFFTEFFDNRIGGYFICSAEMNQPWRGDPYEPAKIAKGIYYYYEEPDGLGPGPLSRAKQITRAILKRPPR